jgi:hypothetical protein
MGRRLLWPAVCRRARAARAPRTSPGPSVARGTGPFDALSSLSPTSSYPYSQSAWNKNSWKHVIMLRTFAPIPPGGPRRATKGEGVVAGEGLPRHKGELGALPGYRRGRKRLLLGPRRPGAREGARRRAASKAARNKSDAELKGVKVAAPSPRRPRVVR